MNLRNIFLIMRHEIQTTLRRAFFLIFAFVIPIGTGIVAIVMYTINNNAPAAVEESPPEVVDVVQGFVDPAGYIQSIPEDMPYYTYIEYDSETEAQAALDEHQISGFYLIPEDFLETGELTFVVLEFNLAEENPDTYIFQRLLGVNLFGENAELGLLAVEPMRMSTIQITKTDGPLNEDNWLADRLPFLLVILLYIVILVPASSLVNSITDEKKNQVIEILLSSVSPGQFFIGKLMALGLLGIFQTLIWVGVIWSVAEFGGQPLNLPVDFSIPPQLLVWAIIFSFTGYAMYGTQMAGIGALAPDVRDTRSLTMLVLMPLLFGYTFNVIFLDSPNTTFALALSLFPLTAPVVMIGRMASTTLPVWQPAVSLLLQLVAIVWIVRLFTKLFRAQALLSGQTPSVKGLIRALRAA